MSHFLSLVAVGSLKIKKPNQDWKNDAEHLVTELQQNSIFAVFVQQDSFFSPLFLKLLSICFLWHDVDRDQNQMVLHCLKHWDYYLHFEEHGLKDELKRLFVTTTGERRSQKVFFKINTNPKVIRI